MAGHGSKAKKPGRGKGKPASQSPAARPVLGNDPFERGAAVRPPAEATVLTPLPPVSALEAPAFAAPEAQAPAPQAGASGPSAPSAAIETVRSRLSALESRLESASATATARLEAVAETAASRLGELAGQEASGQHARDLLQTISRLLPAIRERLGGLAGLRSVFTTSGDVDAFGMDRQLAQRAMPVAEFLYGSWWRTEARQIENVPATGPVVLVANHGGILPWDALVLRVALLRDHRAHREARPLLDEHALRMPLVGGMAVRLGAVPATPENALRLLDDGAVVGVFPEGSRSSTRPWPDRYRVQRFGRGGFVKLALRARAAIVPCAIVGSEETALPMARAGWLSAALGMPFLSSPPALPAAPFGLFPLPARWSLRFGAPVETGPGPEAAEDPARVLEITERVRAALQQMLDEDVAARRSVYL